MAEEKPTNEAAKVAGEANPVIEQPAASPDHRAIARLRRIKHRMESAAAFVLACRIVCGIGLVSAALVVWFWIAGLPPRATRLILSQLESPGLTLESERLWLDPLEGIKARNLRVIPDAKSGGAAGPIAAREVLVNLNWLNLLAGGPALEGLTVRGGSATLRLPPEFGTNGLPCDVSISNVNAVVVNTWNMFSLEKFSAQWSGGTVEASGVTVIDAAAKPATETDRLHPPPRGQASPLDASLRLQEALGKSPLWTRELYQHLSTVERLDPVKIFIAFQQHSSAPELGFVKLRMEGGSAMNHGIQVDGFAVEASYARGLLSLPKIELRAEGLTCRLDGRFVVTNQMIELHAMNELPPSYWQNLLPKEWLAGLSHTPMSFRGALRSEIWLPPATLTNFGKHWRGALAWDEMTYRDLKMERGRVEILRTPDTFSASNFSGFASRQGMSGPVAADLRLNLHTLDAEGRIRATADPKLFFPWIPPATREYLSLYEYSNGVPTVDCTFQAGGPSNHLFAFQGPMRCTNFTYRGVALTHLDTFINYSNQLITLAPFSMTRTNGSVYGRLDLDLKKEIYSFDLHSTTDPLAIGQLVSPQLKRALAVGHYRGPIKIHAWGTYDNNPAKTDLSAEVEAERIGIQWFTADHATFTLRNRGRQYETTNIVASAFGGESKGRFFVYVSPEKTGDRFELDLETRSNDLKQVALAMHPELKDPPPGRMKLRLQVAGLLDDKEMASLKGEGSVKISDGELNKIRLLGGLSTLLSKLSTDLGYATQSGLAMTFDIREGKLSTTDLVLEGSLMSVKAKGVFTISGSKLDFLAEAQLLKKGTVVGETIRFLTTPVTKLFQIQLNGTLAEPEWKNANLPNIF